jgi:hypothetical protein
MAIRTTCYMDERNLIKYQDPGSCRLQMIVSGGFWSTARTKCYTEPECLSNWLRQCFPNPFDVAVPLTSLFISHGTPWGKHIFFKLIYFLIISYVTDKVVYCCWVSICGLINDVILFIYLFSFYFYISRYPRVPRNPGWESLGYGDG